MLEPTFAHVRRAPADLAVVFAAAPALTRHATALLSFLVLVHGVLK